MLCLYQNYAFKYYISSEPITKSSFILRVLSTIPSRGGELSAQAISKRKNHRGPILDSKSKDIDFHGTILQELRDRFFSNSNDFHYTM
ncbi:hypothetical protein K504DRAFT_144694 [Pleomassaria siparia CBS 279.74]|uniref:Uncharacterized protein n=1 Tax=Pleomassaria siparia CBS 279.74 TaxID=1314801 RepID=A0A6G1KN16_9PLEO|nr:hypothetical protein K504DRAFT_144694 [Pleomassaria siparia CBS 279.74]